MTDHHPRPPTAATDSELASFPKGGIAVVFGGGGGIGGALLDAIRSAERFERVIAFSRSSSPSIDLLDEATIDRAAAFAADQGELRLVIDATGFLHDDRQRPEKSWREINAAYLARSFALNSIGPALIMKHILPRLPRSEKAVFATLSARVGSIGDNRMGGWYSYRASKAALNQLVRTSAIELARRSPEALCIALHPGTVATKLSEPFVAYGLEVHPPAAAARHLLSVVEQLEADATGGFYDWRGQPVAW
jgi:NAD(P)-dependent dehydrogenase (short-subunit alcohol dehydrogenase family)|nr:SDR family NAD(P)-dependent oxidoreductase [Bosea sp. AS-1]